MVFLFKYYMCVCVCVCVYTLKHRKQIQKYFCDLICFRNLSILLLKDRLDPFERTDLGKRFHPWWKSFWKKQWRENIWNDSRNCFSQSRGVYCSCLSIIQKDELVHPADLVVLPFCHLLESLMFTIPWSWTWPNTSFSKRSVYEAQLRSYSDSLCVAQMG